MHCIQGRIIIIANGNVNLKTEKQDITAQQKLLRKRKKQKHRTQQKQNKDNNIKISVVSATY